MTRKIKNNKGFTLLELIIVMTIIGFIAFLVPPLMSNTIDNLKFKTAAKQMSNSLRFAKNLSINTRAPVTVNIDNKSNNYWLSTKDTKNLKKDTIKKLGKKVRLDKKISITVKKNFKSDHSFMSGRFENILEGMEENISNDLNDSLSDESSAAKSNGTFSITFQPNGNSSGGLIELRRKSKAEKDLENNYFTIQTSLFSGRVTLTEHRP